MRIAVAALLFLFCSGSALLENERPTSWAQKLELTSLENGYKVSDDLYRSEQPSLTAITELEELGIKTVINFRNLYQDKKELKGSSLKSVYIPIKTKKIGYENLIKALQEIKRAEKPVLIHCWHGSDRTGAVTAAYRMAVMNWTKEEAINEFRNGGFGYHEKWFPSILTLLESIDVDSLKKDLGEEPLR
ncbi:MAG: dual specificity protein phosphatase family protein [Flavobacteriales bacterium]|nr:dual specificity protein phosphatase family protein [Flavobacteriales bacterium]